MPGRQRWMPTEKRSSRPSTADCRARAARSRHTATWPRENGATRKGRPVRAAPFVVVPVVGSGRIGVDHVLGRVLLDRQFGDHPAQILYHVVDERLCVEQPDVAEATFRVRLAESGIAVTAGGGEVVGHDDVGLGVVERRPVCLSLQPYLDVLDLLTFASVEVDIPPDTGTVRVRTGGATGL